MMNIPSPQSPQTAIKYNWIMRVPLCWRVRTTGMWPLEERWEELTGPHHHKWWDIVRENHPQGQWIIIPKSPFPTRRCPFFLAPMWKPGSYQTEDGMDIAANWDAMERQEPWTHPFEISPFFVTSQKMKTTHTWSFLCRQPNIVEHPAYFKPPLQSSFAIKYVWPSYSEVPIGTRVVSIPFISSWIVKK